MAAEQQPSQHVENDEITLKELILKIQEFALEVWRCKWQIGLIAVPFIAYFLINALFFTPTTYIAKNVFMLNDDQGGKGGFSDILSLVGGGNSGDFNMDKVIALTSSGKIIYNTLLSKAQVDAKDDFIANHILNEYNINNYWKENSSNKEFYDFRFTHNKLDSFNYIENSALKLLSKVVVGKFIYPTLMSISYDETTNFITLTTNTENDDLSLALNNRIYEELSSFYVLQKTEPQLRAFEKINSKRDSIKSLVNSKELRLAQLIDSRRNLTLKTSTIEQKRLSREIQILYVGLGKVEESLQEAEFLLTNETPFFQVIDPPIPPLAPEKPKVFKSGITGVILGCFIGIFFIIFRKIFRDTMN